MIKEPTSANWSPSTSEECVTEQSHGSDVKRPLSVCKDGRQCTVSNPLLSLSAVSSSVKSCNSGCVLCTVQNYLRRKTIL